MITLFSMINRDKQQIGYDSPASSQYLSMHVRFSIAILTF